MAFEKGAMGTGRFPGKLRDGDYLQIENAWGQVEVVYDGFMNRYYINGDKRAGALEWTSTAAEAVREAMLNLAWMAEGRAD